MIDIYSYLIIQVIKKDEEITRFLSITNKKNKIKRIEKFFRKESAKHFYAGSEIDLCLWDNLNKFILEGLTIVQSIGLARKKIEYERQYFFLEDQYSKKTILQILKKLKRSLNKSNKIDF